MPITRQSVKKFPCNYCFNDVNITVRTVTNRQIIFGLPLSLEKAPAYNWVRGDKNGPEFETLHPD